MLPCFRPAHSASADDDSERDVEAHRTAKRKSASLSAPQHDSSSEEPFSSPSSSAPLSPASPPPGKRSRIWEDSTMDLQQRVLLAVEDGDVSVLKELVTSEERLLKLLAWNDSDGDKIVHVLARCGNNDAISLLLAQPPLSELHGTNSRRSAFLNATNSVQETPMLIALGAGNFSTASLLLLSGADPWLQNYNRESAFYMACYTGAIEVVTRILQSKSCSPALVRATSGDGLSGQACATTRGNTDVVDAIKEYLETEAKKKAKD